LVSGGYNSADRWTMLRDLSSTPCCY
jgi:hypothetical protein